MALTKDSKIKSRYYLTSEEMQMLETLARRYSMSRTAYFEAALKDVADRKFVVMLSEIGKREFHINVKLDPVVVEKAKKDAAGFGITDFPTYVRQRIFGGLSTPPPVRPRLARFGQMSVLDRFDVMMGISKPTGRRRNTEILMELSNGSLLRALTMDRQRMATFVEAIFQHALGTGIEPGDIGTMLSFIRCLISAETMRSAVSSSSEHSSDPDVIQASKSKVRFVVWSPLHGRVAVEEPPHTERRSDYVSSVRKMRRNKD